MGGNCRRYDRIHKHALFLQFVGYLECLEVVADVKRDDRGGSVAYLASHLSESIKGEVCHSPKVFLDFRLAFHDVEGSHCRCG